MGYSINQRNLYMKYRKWFCVLNSYSINRNIQLREKKKFKDLKRLVQRELRRAYWKYIENIVAPPEDDNQYSGPSNDTQQAVSVRILVKGYLQ